jgi:hypothetical protein
VGTRERAPGQVRFGDFHIGQSGQNRVALKSEGACVAKIPGGDRHSVFLRASGSRPEDKSWPLRATA